MNTEIASDNTIYALSTPAGRGAVAIIRVSGEKTTQAIDIITKNKVPPARQAAVRQLYNPQDGSVIDEALVLYFKAPHSYSGEDMAELHVHGGAAVIEETLAVLSRIDGLAPAEPGAFTRRAVLNGRFDLTRAEAVADLIDAETHAQKTQALRQLRGALGVLYGGWRERLERALAHLEADIEFADEDLLGGIGRAVLADVTALADEIRAHLAEGRGRALRDGVEIAIIGAPNVGKSSLLNQLAGREAAIVSARAGTTRDIIEVSMVIAGVPVVVADTAGLRAAGDEIEREGVRRATKRAAEADMKLFVFAPQEEADIDRPELWFHQEDLSEIQPDAQDVAIYNKSDLGAFDAIDKAQRDALEAQGFAPLLAAPLAVSAKTGDGMAALWAVLEARVSEAFGLSDHPALTRQRHKDALESALVALSRALDVPEDAGALELVAEDMRLAMREIGRITGAVDVEALLDIVFRDFCIGK